MKNIRSVATLAVVGQVLCGQVPRDDRPDAGASPATRARRLVAFGSADALRDWLDPHRPAPTGRAGADLDDPTNSLRRPTGTPPAPPSRGTICLGPDGPGAPGGVVETGSFTNNRAEGVNEGDIVKTHGDHLVILRRGRLFTVSTAGGRLRAISRVDAWGRRPGSWYDELLVDGDTVVVVGYTFNAHATEIGRFDINAAGALRWRDTTYVRAGDHYLGRNYASRVVGHHLVMYMPVELYGGDPEAILPVVQRAPDAPWETVLSYQRLYRPVQPVGYSPVIHTVMSCDLRGRAFDCQSVGVVGPGEHAFYASGTAVYLWVHGASGFGDDGEPLGARPPPPAVVYRFPLDHGAPGVVRVRGAPLDEFSFDERGDTLRVLVRAERDDGAWGPGVSRGDVALLRVPAARFRDELSAIEGSAYRGLPRPDGTTTALHNRFVGDRLLYGEGVGWQWVGANSPNYVQVYDATSDRTARVNLNHSVERIEPLGRDALVVGSEAGRLTFSAVALDATPTLAGRYTVPGAAQRGTNSQGFLYQPDGDRRGTLGIPITTGRDSSDWQWLREVSSSVTFLGVDGLQFRELGALRSAPVEAGDQCVASPTDWYGNTRPIFWRGRVFALTGYELIEGRLADGHAQELRRVNFLGSLPPAEDE